MNTHTDFTSLNQQRHAAESAWRHILEQASCSRLGIEKPARSIPVACPELTPGAMLVLDEGQNQPIRGKRSSTWQACRENADKGASESSGLSLWLVQGASWFWTDGTCETAESSLGLELITRAQARGVPFEAVTCSTLFGENGSFRAELTAHQIQYMVEVPASQRVYLIESIGDRLDPVVKDSEMPVPRLYHADQIACHPQTEWQRLSIRISERYVLNADFAARRVQTVWHADAGQLHTRQEWLVMRRTASGKCDYALSNAPDGTTLSTLARYKAQRFF